MLCCNAFNIFIDPQKINSFGKPISATKLQKLENPIKIELHRCTLLSFRSDNQKSKLITSTPKRFEIPVRIAQQPSAHHPRSPKNFPDTGDRVALDALSRLSVNFPKQFGSNWLPKRMRSQAESRSLRGLIRVVEIAPVKLSSPLRPAADTLSFPLSPGISFFLSFPSCSSLFSRQRADITRNCAAKEIVRTRASPTVCSHPRIAIRKNHPSNRMVNLQFLNCLQFS